MECSQPVDGFRLADDRPGTRGGLPVLLLHGWPGDRHDWRAVVGRLGDDCELVVPDLRGFGESDALTADPREGYGGSAQPRSALGLLEELGLDEFFADVTLEQLPAVGHFTPLEAPDRVAAAIRAAGAR